MELSQTKPSSIFGQSLNLKVSPSYFCVLVHVRLKILFPAVLSAEIKRKIG